MAENAGFATLQIIPSLKGIEGSLSKALGGVEAAGKKAGDSIGKGMVDGIDANKAAVAKAAEQVAKVRDKEADAADKVKVAEAQLQTLRDRGITDAGRLAGAEAKVEKAKRDHARASKATKDAVTAEEKAQAKLAEAEKEVEKATDGATSSGGRFSRMMRSMKTDVNATGEAEGLAVSFCCSAGRGLKHQETGGAGSGGAASWRGPPTRHGAGSQLHACGRSGRDGVHMCGSGPSGAASHAPCGSVRSRTDTPSGPDARPRPSRSDRRTGSR